MNNFLRLNLSFFLGFLLTISYLLSFWEGATLTFCTFVLLHFVANFGKSIYLILDSIILLASLTWLFTPLFFYHYYNDYNELAVLWVKTMQVDSDTYYSYVLLGVLALWLGLRLKKIRYKENEFQLLKITKNFPIQNFRRIGIVFTVSSFFAAVFINYIPNSFAYIVYLFQKLLFVGLIYLYYSSVQKDPKFLILGFGMLMFTSVQGGMFGEMVFILLIAAILFSTNFVIKLKRKILIAVLGISFIILVQSVKADYRKVAWVSGADYSLYLELILNKIANPGEIIDGKKLFATAVRFNQGWLIASTMARVPSIVPFANGETITSSIAAIVIPRFLWPDKPEAGGKYNLQRFLGLKNLGYSMNIGPIGEAWANFGKWGGILFMFFYGFFIRLIFDWILSIVQKRPTVIIWFPLLFFYAVGVETDILTTMNSLVKTCIFVAFIFWIFPKIFKVEL